MLLHAFTVFDSKSKSYNTPWFARSKPEAERNFVQLVKDEKSMVNQFPEDFDLFYIGTYDDNTAKFDLLETPEHMFKALTLKNQS
ncbi:nonstructural protein [Apis mellifera associated microvirus 20]|nr:nonstructural protein [Apis mellifera associated microvirus 20]